MNLKKYFLALIAVVSLIGFVACSDDDDNANGNDFSKDYEIVLCDSLAPYTFQGTDGKLTGIEYDIINYIAKHQNIDFDFKICNQLSECYAELQKGDADAMIGGILRTDAKRNEYTCSDPVLPEFFCLSVTSKNKTLLATLEDLRGEMIGVLSGSEAETFADQKGDKYGFGVNAISSFTDLFQFLFNGTVNGIIGNYAPVAYVQNIAKKDLVIVESYPETDIYTTLLTDKDKYPELITKFNAGLAKLKADTATYHTMLRKYGLDALIGK